MGQSLRVSLSTRARPRCAPAEQIRPALDPVGPVRILGCGTRDPGAAESVAARRDTLFGPRGACLAQPDGPLYVADTGHHRLMIWDQVHGGDFSDADWQIGQRDFHGEGRNGKSRVSACSLNVPTGIAASNGRVAVADAWNHRVLIWLEPPRGNNIPADLVLGQPDFGANQANQGGSVSAASLNWCYGVAFIGGRLLVADTGNRRVLIWNKLPSRNAQPADRVLGQKDFASRDENGGAAVGGSGMRWPHAMTAFGCGLCVADAGNNRLMCWRDWPRDNGASCDFVLGQHSFAACEHNGGKYWPDSTVLNMPYGVSAREDMLLTADTANSRILGWPVEDLPTGADAESLAGQPDFHAKGDNRWEMPGRDSLCWPYAIQVRGDVAAIADSGNNRILLWRLAA